MNASTEDIRNHEYRVMVEAAARYGYRSVESYVAKYHDEIQAGTRTINGIYGFLLNTESKKDKTLTKSKVTEIVDAIRAVTQGPGETNVAYMHRVCNNTAALRVKRLCLNDMCSNKFNADDRLGKRIDALGALRSLDNMVAGSCKTVEVRENNDNRCKPEVMLTVVILAVVAVLVLAGIYLML